MNVEKLKSLLFRNVGNLLLDPQTGSFGLKSDSGEGVFFNTTTGTVSVNPISDLCLPIPGIATRVPFTEVASGDIVVTDPSVQGETSLAFVERYDSPTNKFRIVDSRGLENYWSPPSVQFFNQGNTVLCVKNMMSNLSSGGGMNSILPFLLMKDSSSEMSDILPFLMMGNMGQGGMNPLMLSLLLSKEGGKNSMSPFAMIALTSAMSSGAK